MNCSFDILSSANVDNLRIKHGAAIKASYKALLSYILNQREAPTVLPCPIRICNEAGWKVDLAGT